MSTETNKTHDLDDFMQAISRHMADEYARIQKRVKEDPGTAGDQGEENWASILREWLPKTYHVVTKGRIINASGEVSPQVDVLVLKPTYPPKLLDVKLYLAAGVAAAFECKITLRSKHIREAIDACIGVKSLYMPRVGSPYKELHAPIIYGLIAHSHEWSGDNEKAISTISALLMDTITEKVSHPRLEIDLICIANLTTWGRSCITFHGPHYRPWGSEFEEKYGKDGSALTGYIRDEKRGTDDLPTFQSPKSDISIGGFLASLYEKLAMEDKSMQEIADYFNTAVRSGGYGQLRSWPASIYSEQIRDSVVRGIGITNGQRWNEWSTGF